MTTKHGGTEISSFAPTPPTPGPPRLIGEKEESIILVALGLSSRTVREVMLPAEHISLLYVNSSLTDSLVTAHLEMHTRVSRSRTGGRSTIDPRLRELQGSGGPDAIESTARRVAASNPASFAKPVADIHPGRLPGNG